MIYKTNPLIDIYLYFSFTSQYTFRNSYQHKIYAMFQTIHFHYDFNWISVHFMNVIFRGSRKTNTSVHYDELLCFFPGSI